MKKYFWTNYWGETLGCIVLKNKIRHDGYVEWINIPLEKLPLLI